jgi:hypothetical protein
MVQRNEPTTVRRTHGFDGSPVPVGVRTAHTRLQQCIYAYENV